jgi:molybdopterin molybdotransferase
VRRGEVVVTRSRRIGPPEIAALAALGIGEVAVAPRPKVAILSTGNELAPEPRPGRVRDVNMTALAVLVARAGGEPRTAGICADDAAALRGRIAALAGHDLILVSGGSSVGARDFTARVLEDLGAEIRFHGIEVRPGKPTLLALLEGTPVVGLPGVPASAVLIFQAFVRPLVARLGGEAVRDPWPHRARARLARAIPSQLGREDWVRVRRDGDVAHPVPGNSLAALRAAEGLITIPAGRDRLDENEDVEVLLP